MLRLLRLISYPQLRASWGRTVLVVGGIATGPSPRRLVGWWLVLVAISAAALALGVRHPSIGWGHFGSRIPSTISRRSP